MIALRNRLFAVAASLILGALLAPRPAEASIPSAISHPQFTPPTAPSYVLLYVAPDGSCQVQFCRNDPVNLTDPLGLFEPVTLTVGAILCGVTKAVDYGWTAWDSWEDGRTIARRDASAEEKFIAAAGISVGVLFEVVEPDDWFPIGLPLDDLARRGVIGKLRNAIKEGGIGRAEALLREQFGPRADDVIRKIRSLAGLSDEAAETGAKQADSLAARSGKTVLGKHPDYINLADDIGAKRFNVPTDVWNKMSKAEQWTANKKFLDRMISRGDDIILSNPVNDINKVSGAFRQELDYLVEQGFRLSNDGTRMIR
jgi:hypothetical protein